jgi:hypothetical protein
MSSWDARRAARSTRWGRAGGPSTRVKSFRGWRNRVSKISSLNT